MGQLTDGRALQRTSQSLTLTGSPLRPPLDADTLGQQ